MQVFCQVTDQDSQEINMPGVGKWECLRALYHGFPPEIIKIYAHGCTQETMERLEHIGSEVIETVGNKRDVLLEMMKDAIDSGDYAYFTDDAHIHHFDAYAVLMEGVGQSEYISLYDEPLKYTNGVAVAGRLSRGQNCHWLLSDQAGFTFSASPKAMKDDLDVFEEYQVTGNLPGVWKQIEQRGKPIASAIPGLVQTINMSNHVVNGILTLEGWATDLMIDMVSDELLTQKPRLLQTIAWIRSHTENPVDILKMLEKAKENPAFSTLGV